MGAQILFWTVGYIVFPLPVILALFAGVKYYEVVHSWKQTLAFATFSWMMMFFIPGAGIYIISKMLADVQEGPTIVWSSYQ